MSLLPAASLLTQTMPSACEAAPGAFRTGLTETAMPSSQLSMHRSTPGALLQTVLIPRTVVKTGETGCSRENLNITRGSAWPGAPCAVCVCQRPSTCTARRVLPVLCKACPESVPIRGYRKKMLEAEQRLWGDCSCRGRTCNHGKHDSASSHLSFRRRNVLRSFHHFKDFFGFVAVFRIFLVSDAFF